MDTAYLVDFAKLQLSELNEIFRAARIGAMQFPAVFEELQRRPDRHLRDLLLNRISVLKLSDEESQKFGNFVLSIATAEDLVRQSKVNVRVDRELKHLSRFLREDYRQALARKCFDHKRYSRRSIAYQYANDCGLDSWLAEAFFDQLKLCADTDLTRILATNSTLLTDSQIRGILPKLDEYWKSRTFQALLEGNRVDYACRLSKEFPKEFVWAVGRSGKQDLIPYVRALFSTHARSIWFLGIYCWCLERLNALEELAAAEDHVSSLYKELDAWTPSDKIISIELDEPYGLTAVEPRKRQRV